MRQRTLYTLVGIILVTLLAIITDVSGNGPFTLNLGRPITISAGLDLQGGALVLLRAVPASGQTPDDGVMAVARQIIESRINSGFGVAEPMIQTVKSGNARYISVELPGLKKNLQDVEDILRSTGQLTLVALGPAPRPPGASAKGYQVLARGNDLIAGDVAVGSDLKGALVSVAVRDPSATVIATYTASHVGDYMGIAIDDTIYSSPQIQSALTGGRFEITNLGSIAAANNLAIKLRYGALPVPLKIQSVQSVSASLGPANVRAGILAGLTGIVVVVLFMALHYRLPGLLANGALGIYALVVFALFKLIPVMLTLAGIAGFILSVGMAVDANILIFERMKEDLRGGRSIGTATDAGFARAWPSIRDSNVSTMITCAILYWFGITFATSTIAGFAKTLFIGVVVSMLTAILVSRTFLRLVLASRQPADRALFGDDIVAPPDEEVPHELPRVDG